MQAKLTELQRVEVEYVKKKSLCAISFYLNYIVIDIAIISSILAHHMRHSITYMMGVLVFLTDVCHFCSNC